MSKASEWAKLDQQMRLDICKGDEARAGGGGLVLTHFNLEGNISEQISYLPQDALKLARWILDTFEDAPRA